MNTDYLKWDAQSLQQLLRRKLLQQGVYTDQLYPGSDTKVIMDLFAWTFDVLTYILNNNASDSLFADTIVYQNMNRIVKLLAYNPDGYHTSNTTFKIDINSQLINTAQNMLPDNCTIPKFTSLSVGRTDENGNDIKYSFTQDYSFSVYNTTYGNSTIITPDFWPILYNGQFKKYPATLRATGIPYATFLLNEIDPKYNVYVDHDCFHVYVETIDTETSESKYEQWNRVQNLVLNSTSNSHDYEIRLNENRMYVLSFGDDIHGKKLQNGNKIHIIYLQSNVQEGKIQNGEVSVDSIEFKINGFTNNAQLVDICFGGFSAFKRKYKGIFVQNNVMSQSCSKLSLSNIKQSSEPSSFESVQSIRQNAPGMFRMGNRLVTIQDYTNYFLTKFSNMIQDVWVCNNTTYATTFYQWLYKYDKLNIDIRKYNYLFCDTCDFNNIYIWMKSKTKVDLVTDDMNNLIAKCNQIKTATTQLVPCNAIIKYYTPYVNHPNYPINISTVEWSNWQNTTKIRITKKPGTYFTNTQIKQDINNIIVEYFKTSNQTMGNSIKIEQIYNKIMQLDYIQSIKTVNIPKEDENNEYEVAGLSFACFTIKIIDGADFDVVRYSDQLLPFQFAQLYVDSLINNIQIQNNETFSLTNSEF